MEALAKKNIANRYDDVSDKKSDGATFTPKILADFVADQILAASSEHLDSLETISLLDPAIGDGELVISLVRAIQNKFPNKQIKVKGFETNFKSIESANRRLSGFNNLEVEISHDTFLDYVLQDGDEEEKLGFDCQYDLIIANPPYVRTQILGASDAQNISKKFGLSGRIDLYYAFLFGMASLLHSKGTAGIIVSNRFMSTKSGSPVRKGILEKFSLESVWDLGDTKIFDAAVLPAVILAKGKDHRCDNPTFTSIYESSASSFEYESSNPIDALSFEGITKLKDGRFCEVKKGHLKITESNSDVWRLTAEDVENWLGQVENNTWALFADIGKIRVGVKTTADKVFIIKDSSMFTEQNRPELLKNLTTHHIANRFKAIDNIEKKRHIVYTHEVVDGQRRAISLDAYPKTKQYLEDNKEALSSRKYVIEAGRNWYEIWVPQDPDAWIKKKIVFRDISEKPTFWMDDTGSVVNGDCYWLAPHSDKEDEALWLALAVANSTFIEKFYDICFPNKLYAGRRRYITQYVEKFPIPDPNQSIGKTIISKTKAIFKQEGKESTEQQQNELNALVWESFGLTIEEV